MLRLNLKGYNYMPTMILLPFLEYIILHKIGVQVQFSLFAVLFTSLIAEAVNQYAFKNRFVSVILSLAIVDSLIVLLFWLFLHNYIINENIYQVLYELVIIVSTLVLRMASPVIRTYYRRKTELFQKHSLSTFFSTGFLVKFTLSIHIALILIYKYLLSDGIITNVFFWDFFLFTSLPIIATIGIAIYEVVKINLLNKNLNTETWLPILSEKGDVIGRIAQSISLENGNKYMHPVVRLALICGEKVFLQQRKANDAVSPHKYDYPLEKYVYYGHTVEEASETILHRVLGKLAKKPKKKFILKYVFENEQTKRMVFLYSVQVESENQIVRSRELYGKFWTISQIEEAFADEILSENFELEFEYLKNMVLLESQNTDEMLFAGTTGPI